MYDEDTNPGDLGCDICGHPAGHLHDEGVFLCTTHEAEARALNEGAACIEWTVTSTGIAALAARRCA